MAEHERIAELEKKVAALKDALCTAIIWIAGTAGSPLSRDEAAKLLSIAEGRESIRG